MSSSAFGWLLGITYLTTAAFWTSSDNVLQFANLHGLFVVIIGTTVIAMIAVPWKTLKNFFPMIRAVCRKPVDDKLEILELLVEMSEEQRRPGNQGLKPFLDRAKDPFLRDSIEILMEGADKETIEQILYRRVEVQKERENTDAKIFKSLGKYPPATGLLGTILGMIALLGRLGEEGAADMVGPAMSVALSATLYGVIVANLLIIPVADNLMFRTQKSVAKREMIIEGILSIKIKKSPVLIRESLLAHLAPLDRLKVKTRLKSSLPERGIGEAS